MWKVLVLGAAGAGSLLGAVAGLVAAGATDAKERIAVAGLKAERDAATRRAEERREAIGRPGKEKELARAKINACVRLEISLVPPRCTIDCWRQKETRGYGCRRGISE
jgi:hypothetical protein